MSNYRRLISYIYAYEGGIKGKNIGFVKLEARNGQCKISVNVKHVYVGSSDIGVYLLHGQEEIGLGNIFVRNGNGEFRTVVNVGNVENSGITLDNCHGLTIHEVENAWQCYTTIWEDAVEPSAQVALAEVTTEHIKQDAVEQEVERRSIADEIEREVEQEQPETEPQQLHNPEETIQSQAQETTSQDYPEQEAVMQKSSLRERVMQEGAEHSIPVMEIENLDAVEPEGTDVSGSKDSVTVTAENITGGNVSPPPLSDPAVLNALDQVESEGEEDRKIWDFFQKQHAKIPAFDYQHGCEVLTIKPQDIGLLPRDVWVYGNNSFLLHGYYNYRYLILARLGSPDGRPRFLLGVPGNYYSNEKYMASMFGFPEFVLSKKQPTEDGRFGYWYTDIRVED